MLVRAASLDDAARCAEIYAPYVSETSISFEAVPPSADEMARRIATYSASHAWLVAQSEGEVVGYAYGSPHAERAAYLHSCDVAIYVDRACGRRGIGRALYGALLPLLKERDMHTACAGIALPNDASIALHEGFGFTPIGIYREVGWKMGQWHDVGWWQIFL
jgi:L-amino acid N-acyltransferase YncA